MNLIEALKALEEGKKIQSPLFRDDVKYIEKIGGAYYEDSKFSCRLSIFHFIKEDAIKNFNDDSDNFSIYDGPYLIKEERIFLKDLLQDFVQHIWRMEFQKEICSDHVHVLIWYTNLKNDQADIDFPMLKSKYEFEGVKEGTVYTPGELGLV